MTIKIKGVTMLLPDGMDVEIADDVVTVKRIAFIPQFSQVTGQAGIGALYGPPGNNPYQGTNLNDQLNGAQQAQSLAGAAIGYNGLFPPRT